MMQGILLSCSFCSFEILKIEHPYSHSHFETTSTAIGWTRGPIFMQRQRNNCSLCSFEIQNLKNPYPHSYFSPFLNLIGWTGGLVMQDKGSELLFLLFRNLEIFKAVLSFASLPFFNLIGWIGTARMMQGQLNVCSFCSFEIPDFTNP